MWNVPFSLRLTALEPKLFIRAIVLTVQQHSGLRVLFSEHNGKAVKYLREEDYTPEIEVKDFSEEGEAAYLEWADKQARTKLPMLDATPYRLVLANAGHGIYYFYSQFHHIVADGSSVDVIRQTILRNYQKLLDGEICEPNISENSSVATAFRAEEEYLQSPACEKDRQYWLEKFSPSQESLDLAGKPQGESLVVDQFEGLFSRQTGVQLLAYCQKHKVSPFRVMLASVAIVFSRLLRRDDIPLSFATANRHPKSLYNDVGMFVSTLPLFLEITSGDSFQDIVNQASTTIKEAMSHERYPYDMLVSDLRQQHIQTDNLLSCTLTEIVSRNLPDQAELHQHCYGESIIPLSLFFSYPRQNESQEKPLKMLLAYNREMFEPWRIASLFQAIEQVLSQGVRSPDCLVSKLTLLNHREKDRIVRQFNQASEIEWESETTLHQQIEKTARRYPQRQAVVYRGQSLSYKKLMEKSLQLACRLQEKGVQSGQVVGLLADRSVEIVIAQLAILRAGAAFMPIDAGYPDSRIRYMLNDIQAPLVITQTRFLEKNDFGQAAVLNLDDERVFTGNARLDKTRAAASPRDLCTIFYTSGSTGNPKGVLLEHRSVANTIQATIRDQRITSRDKVAKHASFSFDASLLEVFIALMSGAELHIIPDEIRLSLSHLNEYFETEGITRTFLTTQLAEQFMAHIENHSLKTLMTGGEKLRTFKKRAYDLLNFYGPTECSIYVTGQKIDHLEENIPIGRPIAGCDIYILDRDNNPQPCGYSGELCIGGLPVSRGYHNLPEKTASCFVDNPFSSGAKMYRTGDLATWQPDGSILHLGRMDRQIKLRGFRIELGEIEKAMLALDGITEAAVADFQDSNGHLFLCGYWCGTEQASELIRKQLEEKLPAFMVPAHLMFLETMPINASGKIDRKQLPRPASGSREKIDYAAPKTALEKELTALWEEILEQEALGAEADFFACGGDSLRAVALQLALDKRLDQDVELASLFANPSPRKLAAFLEQADSTETETITPAPVAESYPTTVAQQQLFLLQQMKGAEVAYNMPFCLSLKGPLDQKRLARALREMVHRHEAFRTAFTTENGRCVQKILSEKDVYLRLDFVQSNATKMDENLARGFVKPFLLEKPPLMRARLVSAGREQNWLLLDFHHMIFDGISVPLFINELFQLYQGKPLDPLVIQPKDMAVWEHNNEEKLTRRHHDYWLERFTNPPVSELATDFPRSPRADFKGDIYRHLLGEELSNSLKKLASDSGATLHQIFLSALSILAARWSDSEDVCLGTSMGGRDRANLSPLLGMFVRTLPTRHQPEDTKSFAHLLAETRQEMLAIHQHAEYPISKLYEHLGIQRGPGRHPLFDINFVMRNTGMDSHLVVNDLEIELQNLSTHTAKFDLSFAAEEHQDELLLEIDYRTNLYKRQTITRMAHHLEGILTVVSENPDVPIGEIDFLGAEERQSLLRGFNPPKSPPPSWPTVCQAIAEQTARNGDQLAVVAEDGQLSYAELDALANRIARAVIASGAGADTIVAVVADRSLYAVAGMLGALKAGAAYVGLDVNYPAERIAFILEECQPPCLVGTRQQLAAIPFSGTKVTSDASLPKDPRPLDPDPATGGANLAYCIFTSGSTGRPKGVLIEHHSMVNFIHWYATHHQLGSDSRFGAFAAFSFDVSVVQIFAPLVAGATLHIVPEELRRSPKDLEAYFDRHRITHTHFPTQFAEQFMRMCSAKSLERMIVGGDRLKSYTLSHYTLTNEYGPSETAMACLSHDVRKETTQPPVGKPVANTRIYLLDSKGRLAPLGMPGEICVTGTGVGRGYLNQEDLTAASFVADPFFPGERMFRTGDKGRWLENGDLDFIGRMDFQVKIRGYRIEPGEIENCLKDLSVIKECVVLAVEGPGGNKNLAAYYTAEQEIAESSLRNHVKQHLPEYMIPAFFIALEKMPINPNGKIDRGQLPRPEISAHSCSEPLAPRNEKEHSIADAWEHVLGHRNFGLFDSFFNSGGDSLNAIALLAELSDRFAISAGDIFAHTTIAEQADIFQEAETGRTTRLLQLKKLAEPPEKNDLLDAAQSRYEERCQQVATLDLAKVQPAKHILLTGATGTLGIYLLRELLAQQDTRITAIVRGKNDAAATKRLAAHYLDRFQTELPAKNSRLTVCQGNLAEEYLGMDKQRYQHLCHEIDAIVHSAALTSHYGDWQDFVTANISSVENLISFAKTDREKFFHHLSTTSIAHGNIEGQPQVLFTEFDLDLGQESKNLYVRSKLEAEKQIQKAMAQGLKAMVYRAGNITCDSVSGAFQKNVEDNGFFQQLRAYVNLGLAPKSLDVRNMTFVDLAAKAVVTLMQHPNLCGNTFHIQNPHLLSLSSALTDETLGLRLQASSFEKFIDFFAEHANRPGFETYVERLLVHLGWQDWLAAPSQTATQIQVDFSAQVLEACGFSWRQPVAEDLSGFVHKALEDRVALLREDSIFSELSEDALFALAARIKPRFFAPEFLLQREEYQVEELQLVMQGMVETFRHSAAGWIGTVRLSGPGFCFGEEAVPADAPAIHSVEAVDPVLVFALKPCDLRALISRFPEIGLCLLRSANNKVNQTEQLYVTL